MEELKANELKRIDLEAGVFVANGKTYRIEGGLTIERYAELQLAEKEMGFGTTFKSMYEKVKQAYDLLNKTKPADAAVLLNDIIRGMAKLQEKEPQVLKICALYMNTDDEDRSDVSQDMINRKIADWKAEQIDMRDFFAVASNGINGYLEIYRNVIRIISDQTGNGMAASQ